MEAKTCKDENIALDFFNMITFNSTTVAFKLKTDAMYKAMMAQSNKSPVLLPYNDR